MLPYRRERTHLSATDAQAEPLPVMPVNVHGRRQFQKGPGVVERASTSHPQWGRYTNPEHLRTKGHVAGGSFTSFPTLSSDVGFTLDCVAKVAFCGLKASFMYASIAHLLLVTV